MFILDKMDELFRAFCRYYGYSELEVFVFYIVNSLVLLFYWKILFCLL